MNILSKKKSPEQSPKVKEITYAELYKQSIDIQQFRIQMPGLANAFDSLLEAFITKNKIAFDDLSDSIEKLHKENIKYDAKTGKPIVKTIQPARVFDPKTHQPVPQRPKQEFDYFSDVHKMAFEKGWKELMERKCLLKI
jgi:hypothetical protein